MLTGGCSIARDGRGSIRDRRFHRPVVELTSRDRPPPGSKREFPPALIATPKGGGGVCGTRFGSGGGVCGTRFGSGGGVPAALSPGRPALDRPGTGSPPGPRTAPAALPASPSPVVPSPAPPSRRSPPCLVGAVDRASAAGAGTPAGGLRGSIAGSIVVGGSFWARVTGAAGSAGGSAPGRSENHDGHGSRPSPASTPGPGAPIAGHSTPARGPSAGAPDAGPPLRPSAAAAGRGPAPRPSGIHGPSASDRAARAGPAGSPAVTAPAGEAGGSLGVAGAGTGARPSGAASPGSRGGGTASAASGAPEFVHSGGIHRLTAAPPGRSSTAAARRTPAASPRVRP